MSVILSEEHDLIAALHRGTLGAPPWENFLAQLKRRTAADYANLFFQGDHDWLQSVQIPAARPGSDDINEIYQKDFGKVAALPHYAMRLNRVYSLDEFLDPDDPRQSRFKALFLRDPNVRFARIMRVAEPNGGQIWISLGRKDSNFSASDGALLGALANHLAIAAGTHSELERQRLKAGISADAIMRLNFGWFMLDGSGRIIDMSEQAEALVQEAQTLRKSPDGRLVAERADAQGVLRQFLKMRQAGESVVRTVHLFGLTIQEARLALHISHGVTIREAATLLGLTHETARLYSKRIYAKTGTRGQADLVRLILASIVALT